MKKEQKNLLEAIKQNKTGEIERPINNKINISNIDDKENNIFHILGMEKNGKEIAKNLIKNNYSIFLE